MAKSKKVEKETRKLIESVSDMVKKKGTGYKFKTKNKKTVKRIKKTCVHWIYRKGKEVPTLAPHPTKSGWWQCTVCQAGFPIKPLTAEQYEEAVNHTLALVNQIQFYAVKLGGDADDTRMFLRMKKDLPDFIKVSKRVSKKINQKEKFERNRANGTSMSQFDMYNGFGYHAV